MSDRPTHDRDEIVEHAADILRARAGELLSAADELPPAPGRDAMLRDLAERRRAEMRAEARGLQRAASVLEASLDLPGGLGAA
jgi:hypothetical protein